MVSKFIKSDWETVATEVMLLTRRKCIVEDFVDQLNKYVIKLCLFIATPRASSKLISNFIKIC